MTEQAKFLDAPATVSFELRIVNNCSVRIAGQTIKLEGSNDSGAIYMVISQDRARIHEEIVALLTDVGAMLRFKKHIAAGGGIKDVVGQ